MSPEQAAGKPVVLPVSAPNRRTPSKVAIDLARRQGLDFAPQAFVVRTGFDQELARWPGPDRGLNDRFPSPSASVLESSFFGPEYETVLWRSIPGSFRCESDAARRIYCPH